MNYAIILARSKSKRIKKKNIKQFKGKPIIYWTIKNVISSNLFKKVIVSTDDNNIKKLSIKFGAEVPFLRPKKLAGDYIGTKEVIDHSIDYLERTEKKIGYIACFYATSIFAKPSRIKKAIKMLNKNTKFIFVAKKVDPQSFRYFKLKSRKIVKISQELEKRTQDISYLYQDLGQFYIAKYKTWKKEKKILCKGSKPIILKNWQATDIDDLDDWQLADRLYN